MRRIPASLIVMVLSISISAFSGNNDHPVLPVIDESATVEECIEYALASNPELRAVGKQVEAVVQSIALVSAWPEPNVSYGYFLNEVETRVGPQRHRFGISQSIPWPEKLSLSAEINQREVEIAKARLEMLRENLVYEVCLAYYNLYQLRKEIEITTEIYELLEYLQNIVVTRYETGRISQESVLRTQIELEKVGERIATLKDRKKPLNARFNYLLGRPVMSPAPWPENLPESALENLEIQMEELDFSQNPQLLILTRQEERELSGIRKASRAGMPDFNLGVTYIKTGEAMNRNLSESGDDPLIISAGMTLPLWTNKYRAERRQADARHRAVLENQDDLLLRLQSEFHLAVADHREAVRKIVLFRDTLIPQAEQTLQVTQQSFVGGLAGFTELVDAENLYLEMRLSLEEARVKQAKSVARMVQLLGRGRL